MLWQHYVYERGIGVPEMWDRLFEERPIRLLYISGRGFDIRSQKVFDELKRNLLDGKRKIESAKLLLVAFRAYELEQELNELTDENARVLTTAFSDLGATTELSLVSGPEGEHDLGSSVELRLGIEKVLREIDGYTDVVLDVSSFPRVVYLALLTNILNKLVPDKGAASGNPLAANGINFQILVAEDPALDARIKAEDPDNELVLVPGFAGPLHAESAVNWPVVWFPILGEGRVNQLQKVMTASIPGAAEICPVLPHPSTLGRRADNLLIEYKDSLFDVRTIATSNVMYVNESNPFEVYRQLLSAMNRFRESMSILGGCRLVVTPLASKLMTIGAGLACFEIRPENLAQKYGISIPHAEPRRYSVDKKSVIDSDPEISALLLTGEAYQ